MKRFFTSDLHLNSSLINKYAHRPFDSAESAMDALIRNCNQCAKEKDTVIHVGDFYLKGTDRHGATEDVSHGIPIDECVSKFNANIILLSGNHDDDHNCNTVGLCLLLDIGRHWRNVTVAHHPSYCGEYCGTYGHKKSFPHVHLCGHVHDKWLFLYDSRRNVLNVNVGVDVWGYRPVSDEKLVSLLNILKENARFGSSDVSMTRSKFNSFVTNVNKRNGERRAERKAERHMKKGLTAEECERRRIEAMKRKGLI